MIADKLPPIPLPPGTISPATAVAIAAAIQTAVAAVMTYIDAIPLDCPRTT